ncbi:GAF domain-containing SpoIIE family protein phosphatase [Frankia sp. AgB32]|uniref:PP2C family protein-serine/threonine phosphatase n=1 Tax=Frankia sp. AgB32 TaxID=631119 RepID=UPI00200D35E1|nr:GAF domain-containing SpoIIE family protein phosphatase [Frankia sp. AgB32]MCK9893036.1 SpoIIE family protein phosphatase [Frankia sp. AgB32]
MRATGLLDTPAEEPFDNLARLAATLLETPWAFVTVVDDRRSFWKSCIGIDATDPADRQNAVGESFCQYVIESGTELIVTDAATDPRTRDNPSVESMGIGAWIGFPIHSPDGLILGTFCAVDSHVRQWTDRDILTISGLAKAASSEVALRETARRAQTSTAQAVALARTLQDSLLPPLLPDVAGLEVAARYLPATAVGTDVVGDFYDLFPHHDRLWGVALGDVCGKGLDAAKVTALARYTIRAAATWQRSPAQVLAHLNDALATQRPDDHRFLTAIYAVLHPPRGDGSVHGNLALGGHEPPLLRRADGTVTSLGEPGTALGIMAVPSLTDTRFALKPGDSLLLFTDGVTEARQPRTREFFGDDRLRQIVRADGGQGAAHLAQALETAVLNFTEGHASDDTALLILHVPTGWTGRRERRPPVHPPIADRLGQATRRGRDSGAISNHTVFPGG